MVSMLYLPMNDPVAALKMVEDFGDKQRRDRLPGHDGALQAALRQLPT